MFSRRPAFSLLEMIVVVAIMAAAVGFSILYAQTADVRTDLRTQAAIFTTYVRETQSDAAAGKYSQGAGIHLQSDRYVIFEGTTYNAATSTNYTVLLPDAIRIANIALAGGGSNLIFTKPLGETTTSGSLDFVSSSIGQSVHITINSLGLANYE